MNLMFYSTRHLGYPPAAAIRLQERGAWLSDSKIMKIVLEHEGDKVDRIILWDCIEDYLANRLHVKGRPWVCAISTVFADLYSTYRTGLSADEMNIHFILSNCQTFVNNSKGLAKFMNPVWYSEHDSDYNAPEHPNPACLFSCNVPNIEDRDWSLVNYISEQCIRNGKHPVIVGRSLDHMGGNKLPGQSTNFLGLEERSTFVPGYFEVIAPRITDYRAGVIPYEIMFHLNHGRRVVAAKHQVLEPILRYLYTFESLMELNDVIREGGYTFKGRPEPPLIQPSLLYTDRSESSRPSVSRVLEIMEEAREKWRWAGHAIVVESNSKDQFLMDASIKDGAKEGPAEVKSGSPA